MSKPSPEGVTKTLDLLREIEQLGQEIDRLTIAANRLTIANTRYHELQVVLKQHLEQMDVDQKGNFGWSARFAWFIAEVVRQTRWTGTEGTINP